MEKKKENSFPYFFCLQLLDFLKIYESRLLEIFLNIVFFLFGEC